MDRRLDARRQRPEESSEGARVAVRPDDRVACPREGKRGRKEARDADCRNVKRSDVVLNARVWMPSPPPPQGLAEDRN